MGKPKIRIEKWIEEITPSVFDDLSVIEKKSFRELSIVLAARNDSLITHLLQLRLIKDDAEVASMFQPHFPFGDSTNRHTMAYLVGLIDRETLEILRRTNRIRNIFAHNVNAKVDDDAVVDCLSAILKVVLTKTESTESFDRLAKGLRMEIIAWGFLLAANVRVQHDLNGLIPIMPRLELANGSSSISGMSEAASEIMAMLDEDAVQSDSPPASV